MIQLPHGYWPAFSTMGLLELYGHARFSIVRSRAPELEPLHKLYLLMLAIMRHFPRCRVSQPQLEHGFLFAVRYIQGSNPRSMSRIISALARLFLWHRCFPFGTPQQLLRDAVRTPHSLQACFHSFAYLPPLWTCGCQCACSRLGGGSRKHVGRNTVPVAGCFRVPMGLEVSQCFMPPAIEIYGYLLRSLLPINVRPQPQEVVNLRFPLAPRQGDPSTLSVARAGILCRACFSPRLPHVRSASAMWCW